MVRRRESSMKYADHRRRLGLWMNDAWSLHEKRQGALHGPRGSRCKGAKGLYPSYRSARKLCRITIQDLSDSTLAPSDARQTYTAGRSDVARSYFAAMSRAKSSAALASTSATAHPPKPAPVIRAP